MRLSEWVYLPRVNTQTATSVGAAADRIHLARATLGLTQEEFAERLGVHGRTVQHWEYGIYCPRGKSLRRMADVTGRSIAWLLALDPA